MSGRKGMLHYRVETKQEAVRLVLEEHKTYRVVAVQLGIRKSERIEAWVRMYRQEGELSFHKPIGRPVKTESEEREVEREEAPQLGEIEISLESLVNKHGLQKVMDTVARLSKKG